MPQPRVKLQPELMYHIWTHANGNEYLFRTEENYQYFLEKYLHHIMPIAQTFAYCLMPNHLHLMVRVNNQDTLLNHLQEKKKVGQVEHPTGLGDLSGVLPKFISQQFGNLFNAYTKAFNNMYNRKGSLFMRPFNRKLIDSEEYFARLLAYIHLNPVHHGFVRSPGEWLYSSWHAYVSDKNTNIAKREGLAWFGSIKNFIAVHREFQMEMEKAIEVFEN